MINDYPECGRVQAGAYAIRPYDYSLPGVSPRAIVRRPYRAPHPNVPGSMINESPPMGAGVDGWGRYVVEANDYSPLRGGGDAPSLFTIYRWR